MMCEPRHFTFIALFNCQFEAPENGQRIHLIKNMEVFKHNEKSLHVCKTEQFFSVLNN